MSVLRFLGAVIAAVVVFIVVNIVLGGGMFLLNVLGVLPPQLTLIWAPTLAPVIGGLAAFGTIWVIA